MAITRDQAINADTFHMPTPNAQRCYVWRRNGKTQTWKTRPNDFRIPVKFGLYEYGQITQAQASIVYVAAECPACKGTKY